MQNNSVRRRRKETTEEKDSHASIKSLDQGNMATVKKCLNKQQRNITDKQEEAVNCQVEKNQGLVDHVYESELERSRRLKKERLKQLNQKPTKSSCTVTRATPQVTCPPIQMPNPNLLSSTEVKKSCKTETDKSKINSVLTLIRPPKKKTVSIWEFGDGTVVKKMCL